MDPLSFQRAVYDVHFTDTGNSLGVFDDMLRSCHCLGHVAAVHLAASTVGDLMERLGLDCALDGQNWLAQLLELP